MSQIVGQIAPCLWLDRQAEEAAAFWVGVFPNSRIVAVSHYPDDTQDRAGEVLTVEFELNGQHFTALNGGPQFTFSEAVSFQIICADQAEVDRYWTALTEAGGEESECGWCKDRFGLSWQVVPAAFYDLIRSGEPERIKAAMGAMYQMKKLDLAELQRAYDSVSA